MLTENIRDKNDFKNFILKNRNEKEIELFFDIETLRYADKNAYRDIFKPTKFKNITFSFCVAYFDESTLKTVLFLNFTTFVKFLLKTCKNKTNDNVKFNANIILIAQNNNKYDNHFLLRESLTYLDNNILLKNMYLKNTKNHSFETKKKEVSKSEKNQGIFLEKRIKSSNNLEFEFYYKGLHFITKDFIMKTNTNLATIGKKLLDNGLIEKKYLKTTFDYEKYNQESDYTDDEILNYTIKVHDSLDNEELVYIENDVIILALGYTYYNAIFKGFDINKITFSSNVLESYLTNNLSSLQLLNTSLDKEMKLDYNQFEFNNENFYNWLKNHYKGGLNLYNHKYLNKVVENIFSIDINSSYPYVMHEFKIPTFLIDYQIYKKYDEIEILHDDNFYLYTMKKDIFNAEVLLQIDSLVVKNLIVKYYSSSDDYIHFNSNTIKIIEMLTSINIDYLTLSTCISYECVDFGAKDVIEDYYFIKTQGKLDNKIKMESPYNYEILDEINEIHFSQAEVDIAKLCLNGIYGIPALRPYFNVFYRDSDGDMFNSENNFVNSKRNILFSIFVTSGALYNLLKPLSYLSQKEIDDNFIYCDTDSLYLKKNIQDKIPKEIYDPISLGKWDIENETIDKMLVLNHKKYVYYTEKKGLQIRTGGIRHGSFDLNMSFDKFIETQFFDGVEIDNTRSIMNEQGVITIYEAKTKLDKGQKYAEYFSSIDTAARQYLLEKIKKEIPTDLDDIMYIESDIGTFSVADVYAPPPEKNKGASLEVLKMVHNQIRYFADK